MLYIMHKKALSSKQWCDMMPRIIIILETQYSTFLTVYVKVFFFFFVFLGPHPQHVKVPRLGAE